MILCMGISEFIVMTFFVSTGILVSNHSSGNSLSGGRHE
jgi:hypothetical protein